VTSSLIQITITNNLFLAIKHRFVQIRRIQWAIKDWISREAARYELIAGLFRSLEVGIIKRNWRDDDRRAIQDAQQKLLTLHCVKERKISERVVEMCRERYRRYMKPKTEADRAHTQQQLEKFSVPMVVRNMCVYHIYMNRKHLIKDDLEEHALNMEDYQHEMQTWQDINDAVKIIDPSGKNPDPLPQAPSQKPFVFTIPKPVGLCIVMEIRRWCTENESLVEVCRQHRQAQSLQEAGQNAQNRGRASLKLRASPPDASMRPLSRFEMMEYMNRMSSRRRSPREGESACDLNTINASVLAIVKEGMGMLEVNRKTHHRDREGARDHRDDSSDFSLDD